MKKIVGILLCMLVIICGISYSVTAFSFDNNLYLNNKKVMTSFIDPLTINVDVQQIGYRMWLLKAYLKNTWQEKISVKWTYIPCSFNVRYIVPDMEDFEILVYYPYHGFIYQFIPFFKNFDPGEEKLVQISLFYGISNWIIPLIADNCTKYIQDFPILPEGDYRFEGSINPYFVNNQYPQYHAWIQDDIIFHLAAYR